MKDEVVVLLLALVLGPVLGEPPNALHPVVWIGKWIGWGERHAPVSHRVEAFVYGALVVLYGLCLTLLLMFAVLAFTSVLHPSLALFVKAWLLKSTFALMVLVRAACCHGTWSAVTRAN